MVQDYPKSIEHNGRTYQISVRQYPFREGLRVIVSLPERDEEIEISEQGLGEQALLERIRCELEKL